MTHPQPIAGRVTGTEDTTPLEFWVAVDEGQFLRLDTPSKTTTNGDEGPFGGLT